MAQIKNKTVMAKMVCVILYAIVAAITSVWVFSFFFGFWHSFEFVSATCVAFGCVGEWWLFLNPSPTENKRLPEYQKYRIKELLCITLVAIGVTLELVALNHTMRESDTQAGEIASLTNETVRLSINLEGEKSKNLALASQVAGLIGTNIWLADKALTLEQQLEQVAQMEIKTRNFVGTESTQKRLNEEKMVLQNAQKVAQEVRSALESSNIVSAVPRSFSEENQQYAHFLLGKYKGTPFVVESVGGREPTAFGDKISEILTNSGWQSFGRTKAGMIMGGGENLQPAGIRLEVYKHDFLEPASALDTFLSRCHFHSELVFNPNPGIIISGIGSDDKDGVHVIVGARN